jgi:DNA-binding NarL/FixJ family response regulator
MSATNAPRPVKTGIEGGSRESRPPSTFPRGDGLQSRQGSAATGEHEACPGQTTTLAKGARMRLLVVDEHPVVREGLTVILGTQPDMVVVGEAADANGASQIIAEHDVDVVVTEISLPGTHDGIALTERLRSERPGTRVLIFARSVRADEVRQSLRAGAHAVVSKDATCPELVRAVRAVHSGAHYLSAETRRTLDEDEGVPELSSRERQVLELLFGGLSNKDVASSLRISESTVTVHFRNIRRKLRAHGRTDAVRLALRKGILRLD